jgi:hypothetical protein
LVSSKKQIAIGGVGMRAFSRPQGRAQKKSTAQGGMVKNARDLKNASFGSSLAALAFFSTTHSRS